MRNVRTLAPTAGLLILLSGCGGAEPAPVTPAPRAEAERGFPASPPSPLAVRNVDFPDYAERTLRNGARLLVVENHEQPVVSIRLLVPAGSAADPEALTGLASVTASLLDKGTEAMTALEIAEAADFLGAQLGASASSDWSAVYLTTLTDFLDRGLELLSDVVLNPTFPAEELEIEKRRRISQLRLSQSQPGALAAKTFTEQVYGEHPYGQTESAETIGAIEADELERFHDRYYRPGGALFVVAGDVSPDDIARKLDLAFSGWRGQAPADVARAEPPARSGRELVFVHKPGSVQTVIRMGHLFPSATSGDWVTLDVANQVLGSPSAAFVAWMMQTLREEKGYTYGAYSLMSERPGPGTFAMQGEFRNAVADSALAIMIDLAERLRAGDIPPDELETAKSYLTGSFPLDIETPQEVAGQVAQNRLLGRPDRYLEEYRGQVAATTAEEVARVANRRIRPGDMLIVAVGDATEVLDELRPFADRVRVVDTDGRPVDPDRVAAAAAAAAEMSFDASALEPRTMVYGLRFQGNEVGTITVHWRREGGAFVAVSENALPGMQIRQTTAFDPATFEPASLAIDAGGMGQFGVTIDDGRAVGTGLNMQTGQPRDIDVAVPEGTALDGMLDVAIAVTPFDDVGEFTLRVLGGTGEVQGQTVRRVGEETVEVPAGTFETYRLEVSGQQTATLWVTRDAPHIVVRREVAGQPVEAVLKSMQ